MTSISVFESNTRWMNSQAANEAQQLAAEKSKMEETGPLLDAEWAKPEPDLSPKTEKAVEDAEALASEAANKAAGKKVMVTEETHSSIPFSLIKKGLEELQKGGKTIGQVEAEFEIGNFLLKRVRFLAEYFYEFDNTDDDGDHDQQQREAINNAYDKIPVQGLTEQKAKSLIKRAEPLKAAYNNLYVDFDRSSLYDIERPQDKIQTYIPTYSSFPPSQNTVHSAPWFKGVTEKEWDPCASEDESSLPQSFPTDAFFSSTPTYWDWPSPPAQSKKVVGSSIEQSSEKPVETVSASVSANGIPAVTEVVSSLKTASSPKKGDELDFFVSDLEFQLSLLAGRVKATDPTISEAAIPQKVKECDPLVFDEEQSLPAASIASTNKKRKTPAVPDATPVVKKKEKVAASQKKKISHKFSKVTKAIREYQKGEKDVHLIARENGLSSKTLERYIKVLEKFFTDEEHIDDIDNVIDTLGYKFSDKNMTHLVKIALPAKEFYLNHPLVEPAETDPNNSPIASST